MSSTTTTTTTGGSNQSPHILMFPYPAQGHMLAFLDLTHHLALQDFIITIITTPKNHKILGPLLSAHPATIHTLVFPFPSYATLSSGVENIMDIGGPGNIAMMNALSKLKEPIVQWFHSHPNPPVALISDFFLGWTLQLANQINIPRISFSSIAALQFSVLDKCWSVLSLVRETSPSVVDFPDIPGSPSFRVELMPSVFRRCRESNPETDFIKDFLATNISSWGIVINTFEGFEGDYLRYLKNRAGHHRVYGVGPLNLLGTKKRHVLENNRDSADVLAWLDSCPDDSVLYVCFGSQKLLNRQQMVALAAGLERSGVRFLWVVKTGTAEEAAEGYGEVPDGFEEKVGNRGLVVKGWASQLLILNHRAVGGFLNHCGWNSMLEASGAGVTRILGWPMEADQHVNAKLLVELRGVVKRVCEGGEAVPDPDELAKEIAELMKGDAPERMRAKEWGEKALAAVSAGGSSLRDLDELVRELRQLPRPKPAVAHEGVNGNTAAQ
ncbi:UDP-glucuronosyl/UDP-glucosyltransferase [Trema orientale]|uniref:UDP-glucuronosyl/UDP-glucosyltransferase n=1 Tax=Trema orientale TaxID=63057 RepID=A0A2P5DTY7_TREOI|nr:UDP-glucuronosyl/UDP-glucosyltransferase [Trema orientale]